MASEKRKTIDESKLEYSAHPPRWISSFNEALNMPEMSSVYSFFLAYTPCKGISAQGIPLPEYGWTNDSHMKGKYLERRLLEIAHLEEGKTAFFAKKREDEKALFETAGMKESFYLDCDDNRIAISCVDNRVMSIFKVIRNSFAHCRFGLFEREGVTFVAMENGLIMKSQFEVKARLFLSLTTLSNWINVIKTESGKEKEIEEERRRLEQRMLIEMVDRAKRCISDGIIKKQDDLAAACGFSKAHIGKVIGYLKKDNIAEYSRHERRWVLISVK